MARSRRGAGVGAAGWRAAGDPGARRSGAGGWRRTAGLVIALLLAAPLGGVVLVLPAPCGSGGAGTWPAVAAGSAGWRFNLSGSLPRGVYRLTALPRLARPGDLVLACPPPAAAALARRRGYLDAGPCPGGSRPLGKLVLGAAGDRIELDGGGVALNGCRLPLAAAPAADTRGRPLPRLAWGSYRVRTGEVWLVAPHPRSFDSRCFGPVDAGAVRGRLAPLAVLGQADLRRWAALLRSCALSGGGGAFRGRVRRPGQENRALLAENKKLVR
jgi:conjugative transfer signal peptidase TraF